MKTLQEIWQEIKSIFEPIDRAMSMSELDEKVWKEANTKYPGAWLHSTFVDSSGEHFAILSQDGQLYKSLVMISEDDQITLEDWQMVTQEFVPTQTRTTIKRQADGKVRWFSRSATATLNRVGEIDSRQLFDSFVAYIEATGEYPIRQFYHQGEQFRTGQADFVARDGNVLITSGLYDDTALAKAEIKAREARPDYWGESIGYDPINAEIARTKDNIEIPVYTSGILKEISTLPETEAANLFTATYQMEVNRMLTGNVREAFNQLFGSEDEAEKWLNENVESTNRSIEDTGMITRSISDELVQAIKDGNIERAQELIAEDVEPVAEVEAQEGEVVLDDDLIEVVVSRMVDSEPFKALSTQIGQTVAALETINANQQSLADTLATIQSDSQKRLANLERSTEAKKQEWLADLPSQPNVTRVRYQPRQEEPIEIKSSDEIANGTLAAIGLGY